jgi:tRNA threonylcarbamoyladenosine biosynthesis protein TsaB
MSGQWILAFDTATRATAVALCGPGGEELEARDDQPPGERPRHAAKLLPLCARLLEAAGVSFSELDRIAVGVGPGTFTGLRIGVATARALARAAAVDLVGVSTLESVALSVRSGGAVGPGDDVPAVETVLAVLDARRQEAFVAAWELAPGWRRVLAPVPFGPDALGDQVKRLAPSVLAVGEGAIAFREVLERSGAFVPDDDSALHQVSAVGHCRIARDLEPAVPEQVTPEYLRLPDAELARRGAGKQ